MGTINVHLLDSFLDASFITRTLYPSDQIAKLKVSDFASEFFSIFKSLGNPIKMEVSESFRKNEIGRMALDRILELLQEYSKSQSCPGGKDEEGDGEQSTFFKIELSSAEKMKKDWWRKTKNLVVAHLEILYITCRCGKEYPYELFREFEDIQELLILLIEFPDDSTPVDPY